MKKIKNLFNFKKMSRASKILVVGLIVIILPLLIYLAILIKAGLTANHPVLGSRFNNDLSPSISNKMLASALKACQDTKGVEACNIELKTAQVRVNVDGADNLSQDDLKALVQDVYKAINEVLPIATYFTSTKDKKMYDLAINVFNKESEEGLIYFILTKNAMMKEPSIQLVSEPLNKDLAEQLRNNGKEKEDKDKVDEKKEASEDNKSSE